MNTPLEPRVAVVTGAARGIGRALATEAGRRGFVVVITDVDADAVAVTGGEIGAALHLVQDVRDPEAHREVARRAAALGRVALWVNNAGVGLDGTLTSMSDAQVRTVIEVNTLGLMFGMRAAIDAFGVSGGDIVNICSMSSHGPVPGLSVYAASKAAALSISLSVQSETPKAVRIHAVCPDAVRTDLLDQMDPEGEGLALVATSPRVFDPAEIAVAALDMVGTSRVVRTLPAWRGVLQRASAMSPRVSQRAMRPMVSLGRRAMRSW